MSANDYQQELTAARRDAHWRALERMRQAERRRLELQMVRPAARGALWREERGWHGHRRDQVAYSAAVVVAGVWLMLCALAGAAVGALAAWWGW